MQFLDGSITMRTTEGTPLNSNLERSSGTQPNIQATTSTATLPTTTPNNDVNPDQPTEEITQQQDIGNSRRKRRNKEPCDKIIDYL